MADSIYNIEFGGDVSPLVRELRKVQEGIDAKPMEVKVIGKIDSSHLKEVDAFFKEISSGADNLEQITVKYTNFTDNLSGEHFQLASERIKVVRGETGQYLKVVEDLKDEFYHLAKAEAETVGTSIASLDVMKATKEINKLYNEQKKEIESTSKAAESFLVKSEHMTGNAVEKTKSLANSILETKKAYDEAHAAGNRMKMKELSDKMGTLNNEFSLSNNLMTRAAVGLQSWTSTLERAVKQTVAYTFSIGTMRAAQQMLNEAIRFTIELNTEMTKIQVLQTEGASSPGEIRQLAQSYNSLAKELGATTIEIAEGSVEWLRQGKTVAETGELMRASTIMAKLGNTSLAESTEFLTSTMNGYRMETEDAIMVVDKLVHVDNIAATSTAELATALRYTAAVAADAGVEFDQLVSYIATISSTTRLNAEQIGQAMKTLFTRMQDIKAGAIDEDGLGINNVEIALKRVKIELRDTPDTFRDLGDVLEEVAGKWQGLTDIEQANVAKAIAGVRQQNMFRILMEEMGQALYYQEEAAIAAGTALDRYGIYLESIEAKQARLTAGMEELYMSFITEDVIKDVLDLAIGIVNLIDKMGGLRTVVVMLVTSLLSLKRVQLANFFIASAKAVGAYVVGLKASIFSTGVATGLNKANATSQLAMKVATQQTTAALHAQKAALASTGWGIAIILIGALVSVMMSLKSATERANEAIEKSQEKISGYNEQNESIEKLGKRYNELKSILNDTTKSEEEKAKAEQELVSVQNQLKDVLPLVSGHYDAQGNFIIDQVINVRELVKANEDLIASEKELIRLAAEKKMNSYDFQRAGVRYDSADALEIMNKEFLKADKKLNDNLDSKNVDRYKKRRAEAHIAYMEMLQDVKTTFSLMGLEAQKEFIDELTDPDIIKDFEKLMYDLISVEFPIDRWARENAPEPVVVPIELEGEDEVREAAELIKGELEKVISTVEGLRGKKFLNQQEIDILAAYGVAWSNASGEIEITDEALADAIETKRENVMATYAENKALEKLIDEFIRARTETNQLDAAQKKAKAAIDNMTSSLNTLQSVMESYNQTGYITLSQAEQLINAGYGHAISINAETGEITVNIEALRQKALELVNVAIAESQASLAAIGNANANVAERNAIIQTIAALEAKRKALQNVAISAADLATTIGKFSKGAGYTLPAVSSAGGGGGGKSPEENALDAQIKSIEEQIKAIERGSIRPIEDAIKRIQREQIRRIEDAIQTIERIRIRPIADAILKIERTVIRPIKDQIDRIQKELIRPIQDEINRISLEVIRPIQDEIDRIRLETIRPLTDEIARISREIIRPLQDQIRLQQESVDLINEEIKALEGTKKPLEEQLKSFKEVIKLQKEALKLKKEEEDFAKKITKKNEELAKIQTRIALLSLDNSAAARAERLKLEEQAAGLEEEIAEQKEDRKYQLQMDALDQLQEDFERNIQEQIDAIDEVIAQRERERDAIQAVIDQLEAEIETWERQIETIQREIEEWERKIEVMEREIETHERVIEQMEREIEKHEETIEVLNRQIETWEAQIETMQREIEKWEARIEVMNREKEAWQARIEMMQRETEKYQLQVEGLQRQIESLRDAMATMASEATGGGGGGFPSITDAAGETKQTIEDVKKEMLALFDSIKVGTPAMREQLSGMITKWGELGLEIDEIKRKAREAMEVMAQAGVMPIIDPETGEYIVTHGGDYAYHTGGIVGEETDFSSFGGLKSNEVFAKLLKGEYVATEGQMKNFLNNVLPKISSMYQGQPEISKSMMKQGDIDFDLTINVEGSLDKSVLPDLEQSVLRTLNRALEQRGIRRNATKFGI